MSVRPEPRWLTKQGVLGFHDKSLAQHGGPGGVRDDGLLESALARPRNRHVYEGVCDLCDLAATYAAAISGNHPFVDGNKRTAFIACGVFLDKNGLRLEADETDAVVVMMALAAGDLELEGFAEWLRRNVQPAG